MRCAVGPLVERRTQRGLGGMTVHPDVADVLRSLRTLQAESPAAFEQLKKWLDEANRPAYGSITLNFQDSELRFIAVAGTYK